MHYCKFIFLSLIVPALIAEAEDVVVTPGNLQRVLSNLESPGGTLTLKGKINSSDIEAFASLPESVNSLDISGLEFSGGSMAKADGRGNFSYEKDEIPSYLFFRSHLNHIILPFRLVAIGEGAFAGSELVSVKFTGNNENIGDYAFYDCKNLIDVSLSSSVKSIGDMAFAGCEALKSLTLPPGCVLTGERVFANSGIKTLDATGVDYLGDFALAEIPSLTGVSLGKATEGAKGLLMSDPSLAFVSGDIDYVPELFAANSPSVPVYEVVSDVISIGDFAFAGNNNELIYLNKNLSYIGNYAFAGAKALTRVEAIPLGNRVPDVEVNAFDGIDVSKVSLYVTAESYETWKSHPVWGLFNIRPGESGIDELQAYDDGLSITPKENGVFISCDCGIGNYSVTGLEGMVLTHGNTDETSLYIDLSDYKGKMIVVSVNNPRSSRSLRILR